MTHNEAPTGEFGASPDNIISLSSGLGSAYAACLKVEKFGAENVWGVFTDVNGEHPDNYRFLADVQYALGIRVVKINNGGKTIWDVFKEHRFLGNPRVDLCSRVLKREAFLGWLTANADPTRTTITLGIDWMEVARFDRAKPLWAKSGWTIDAPLCEPPYLARSDAQAWLDAEGIKRPALYDLGFSHANCGGGCIKAGVSQFIRLLAADRRWYMNWWERGEESIRAYLDKDVAILRDRSVGGIIEWLGLRPSDVSERIIKGEYVEEDDYQHPDRIERYVTSTGLLLPNVAPLPLRKLRERTDAGDKSLSLFDPDEGEGCGVCFLAPDESEVEVMVA